MTKSEIKRLIGQARRRGWDAYLTDCGKNIKVRSYKATNNEGMVLTASGALYLNDGKGWMCQVVDPESMKQALAQT